MKGKIIAMFAVFAMVFMGFTAVGAQAEMPSDVAGRIPTACRGDVVTYYSGEVIGDGIAVATEKMFKGIFTFEYTRSYYGPIWRPIELPTEHIEPIDPTIGEMENTGSTESDTSTEYVMHYWVQEETWKIDATSDIPEDNCWIQNTGADWFGTATRMFINKDGTRYVDGETTLEICIISNEDGTYTLNAAFYPHVCMIYPGYQGDEFIVNFVPN